ncbi:aminotransferase class I/II-fold pyridoxal phosphate-dependent enzyme [Nanoarchaeota archaeon]
MDIQAEELNQAIERNSAIYGLLSERGRAIFFPKKGILGQTAEAKGKAINATIGAAIEDDGSPMRLQSIAKNILLDPKEVFPYAPSPGKPELREQWLELIKKKNPSLTGKTSLPIVTNALTHGLSMLGYLFVDKGDKIISPDKFWGNYKLIFNHAYGSEIDTFNTFKEGSFDIESLKEKLQGEGKKILLLNFPNNPTGYTPTDQEVDEIVSVIKQSAENKPILVICDDAYFGLVYQDGIYKESIFSKLADLHENVLAVKVDGATKEDYVWGFRIGFITYAVKGMTDEVCKALEAKTGGAVRGNISNAPHISQSLILNSFKSETYDAEKKEKYELLKSRFEKVKEVLQDDKYKKHFEALPFNSGYFMCVQLNKDAEEVRQELLEKYDTGVIAMGNLLRIAFSGVAEKDIKQLFENIYEACGG